MDEDVKTDIAVIKVKLENMDSQMKRFISHVDSERDVRTEQGKRIDNMDYVLKTLMEEKVNTRWKFEQVMAIIATLISFATLFVMVYKK